MKRTKCYETVCSPLGLAYAATATAQNGPEHTVLPLPEGTRRGRRAQREDAAARGTAVTAQQQELYAELDLALIGSGRRSLDVVGHYARPDIFQLHINNAKVEPVRLRSDASAQRI